MLSWSLTFFVVAIIAAVFGFGGIASGAAEIARVCFFFFIVAFLLRKMAWGPILKAVQEREKAIEIGEIPVV